MTKVKICGITNLEDAMLSAKFGADALGFNFYEKSPRYILPEVAREIIDELPENVLKVGVFVNEDLDKIIEIAKFVNLDAIQLHGEETPEFAKELKTKTGLEIIKAFRVSEDFKPEDVLQYEVDAILLDAYSPKEHGGTGETFDWEIAKKVKEIFPKMYLAGGLSNNNINAAIGFVKPFAVDACSCIEEKKGKKHKVNLIGFLAKSRMTERIESNENTNEWKDIYQLFDFVLPRPAMYLGQTSLSLLGAFIQGFRFAIDDSFDWKNFAEFGSNFDKSTIDFRKFLETYFEQELGGFGWNSFIVNKLDGDEILAMDLFIALLEEFRLESNYL